jgi:ketosteroid isomerase-like protein
VRPQEDLPPRGALLRELYAAFNQRDIDRVLASMHQDVLWPNGWEGGYVRGHAGVRDYWRRQWAEIDPVVMPTAFAQEADGRVRVAVHSLVRDRAGQVLAEHVVEHVYTFEGGLVRTMEIRRPA